MKRNMATHYQWCCAGFFLGEEQVVVGGEARCYTLFSERR